MTTAQILVWIYIVLMLAGGLMGFLKAGSKASLIASGIFAAILAVFCLNAAVFPYVWIILLVLLLFFGKRFLRSKKFMPSGLMAFLTLALLIALRFV
jgi:uncharacterized membrane protein (UPF0136 family)